MMKGADTDQSLRYDRKAISAEDFQASNGDLDELHAQDSGSVSLSLSDSDSPAMFVLPCTVCAWLQRLCPCAK